MGGKESRWETSCDKDFQEVTWGYFWIWYRESPQKSPRSALRVVGKWPQLYPQRQRAGQVGIVCWAFLFDCFETITISNSGFVLLSRKFDCLERSFGPINYDSYEWFESFLCGGENNSGSFGLPYVVHLWYKKGQWSWDGKMLLILHENVLQ